MELTKDMFDPIMIKKRDGSSEKLKQVKIKNAIKKAMLETEKGFDNRLTNQIAECIINGISDNNKEYSVEDIQDMIELKLMKSERNDVAKKFILFREKRNEERNKEWEMTEFERGIWENRYRQNGESFNQWIERVSGGNSNIAKRIRNKEFLFGGRILASRGLLSETNKATLSNCYVLAPPEDSIEGIFKTASEMARTYSMGGGVGISLRNLRPRNSRVNNTAKETSGAVSFMELYDLTTKIIGQSGRRGALMISIPSNHPDLEEFIDIKRDVDKITKANISVEIDDNFMKAVKDNTKYELKFVTDKGEEIKKEVDALSIFYRICENNWLSAEPGMLFWDRIKSHHLLSEDENFEYAGVNPCAEEPLPAGGSCLLGAINLSRFVVSELTDNAYFDFDKFKECVKDSVTALNEVLDEGLPYHPLQIQRDIVGELRQIGLGIFGLADMFIKMKYVYGEKESLELSNKISRVLLNEAVRQSALLSKIKSPFKSYDYKNISSSKFFQNNLDEDVKELVKKYGLRNSQILTSAPNGSTSTMLGVSGGIEPIFAFSYTRGSHNEDVNSFSYKIYAKIASDYMNKYSIAKEEDLPEFFISSQEIPYINRIKMQSIWQQNIDASISSTINLPEEATIQDIMNIYISAWEYGLKGVTIYRDNCARQGVLHLEKKENKGKCPSCGENAMVFTNGCSTCQECGFSPCSV